MSAPAGNADLPLFIGVGVLLNLTPGPTLR